MWHAEGDVLTHTRLVVAALTDDPAWRALDAGPRTLVFLAALLHDLEKPATTREQDGRIVSPHHAPRGARRARWLLARRFAAHGQPLAMAHREAVVQLIHRHTAPMHVAGRTDPARAAITLSWQARCDWLAMLARADLRGRRAGDLDEKLAAIDLFEGVAREEGCWDRPRPFASPHTRFAYFQGRDVAPDVELFDDTCGEVVLMSGLPGAGKDTWIATELPDRPQVSLDAIREELRVAPTADQGRVAQVARERAREHLRARRPFIWNATNTTRRHRGARRGVGAGPGGLRSAVGRGMTPRDLPQRAAAVSHSSTFSGRSMPTVAPARMRAVPISARPKITSCMGARGLPTLAALAPWSMRAKTRAPFCSMAATRRSAVVATS